jgi:hypothetical protein
MKKIVVKIALFSFISSSMIANSSFEYKISKNNKESSKCERRCKPFKKKHVDAVTIQPEECYRKCLNKKRKDGIFQMTDQELEERIGKVKFYA